jgi:hypothetical protein
MKSTGPDIGRTGTSAAAGAAVLHGKVSFGSLDDQILAHVVNQTSLAWFVAFAFIDALLIGW